MITIIASLFTAWFLKIFGFFGVVSAGMMQLFGIEIDVLGYYSLFAFTALLRIIFARPVAQTYDFGDNVKNKFKGAYKK